MFLNDPEMFLLRSDHFLSLAALFQRDAEDVRTPSDYVPGALENVCRAPEYRLVQEENALQKQEPLLKDDDNFHDAVDNVRGFKGNFLGRVSQDSHGNSALVLKKALTAALDMSAPVLADKDDHQGLNSNHTLLYKPRL